MNTQLLDSELLIFTTCVLFNIKRSNPSNEMHLLLQNCLSMFSYFIYLELLNTNKMRLPANLLSHRF